MNETTPSAVEIVDAVLPNPYQRSILFALPKTGRHVYQGTADPKAVAKRRAANRAARKARRATRAAA